MSDRTRTGPQLFVLDNVDPDQIKAVVDFVTPKIRRTVVNVISKSGETAETAAQFILHVSDRIDRDTRFWKKSRPL